MSYEIRELKLGGILDQGIRVLKDNFGLLFGILACVWIPYQLIANLVPLAMMDLPADPTPSTRQPGSIRAATSKLAAVSACAEKERPPPLGTRRRAASARCRGFRNAVMGGAMPVRAPG